MEGSQSIYLQQISAGRQVFHCGFMFTVYVLYSASFKKIYIGYTSSLDERIRTHNELGTKGWTIRFRPWEVIYTEIFENKTAAMKREKELKTASGRKWIWQLISNR